MTTLAPVEATSEHVSRIPDLHEATRIADCEAFALRERWAANQRKYFARKDATNA